MLLFLLGLVASVPLAVLANLLTPVVTTGLATHSARRRQTRIMKIRKEIARVERYRDGPVNMLVAYLAIRIIGVVGNFAFTVLFTVIGVGAILSQQQSAHAPGYATYICGLIGLAGSVYYSARIVRFCRKILNPKWYARLTTRELARLGEASVADPVPAP
jgi:hypothetical protein